MQLRETAIFKTIELFVVLFVVCPIILVGHGIDWTIRQPGRIVRRVVGRS